MKKQTKEQEICYINRNTKSITLTGEQINSLIEQGKAQAKVKFKEIINGLKKYRKNGRTIIEIENIDTLEAQIEEKLK